MAVVGVAALPKFSHLRSLDSVLYICEEDNEKNWGRGLQYGESRIQIVSQLTELLRFPKKKKRRIPCDMKVSYCIVLNEGKK